MCDYFRRLHGLAERGAGWTEVVAIGDRAGERYLVDAVGNRIASLAGSSAWDLVSTKLVSLVARPKPTIHDEFANLPHPPCVTLLLVGGGHVGQAVAALEWEVEFGVLDDREKYVGADRFPHTDRRIAGPIGQTLTEFVPNLGANTYALILTSGHSLDEEVHFHLSGSACGYVGMIGSKRKVRLIFDDLIE